jgi:two-component system, NtrC family, response regulator HydG
MKTKESRILIIDDDKDVLTAINLLLNKEAREVVTEKNPENIIPLLSDKSFDLIILDMNFKAPVNTGNEGLFWLRKIRKFAPAMSVMMITAYGDMDLAIRSLKEGASDFIIKPWNNRKLLESISSVLQNIKRPVSENPAVVGASEKIIGESQVMMDLLKKVEKIAPTDANILIIGENGTGKDIIAGLIHLKSLRSKEPFIKVDVGSLTESLFESELFGYRKGAFTDAREDRTGRISEAHKGTLFLDEIGNITLYQQAKLLTVLQNRRVTPLGSNVSRAVDIRLLSATNLPMRELANESKFRKDLVYRINTIELVVPPLRERKEDIPLLAKHFLEIYGEKYYKSGILIDQNALRKLREYHFPGNVRELQYIIERAMIMSDHLKLGFDDIIFSPVEMDSLNDNDSGSETNLGVIEKRTILRVIEKNNGNISRAARELGLTRTALYRRLTKYEI